MAPAPQHAGLVPLQAGAVAKAMVVSVAVNAYEHKLVLVYDRRAGSRAFATVFAEIRRLPAVKGCMVIDDIGKGCI